MKDRRKTRFNENDGRRDRQSLPGQRQPDYNSPEYYNIQRTEFGHGQSGSLNPGRMESYGETSFRGFSRPPSTGRDYEQDIGYRQSYNKLGPANGPQQEPRGMHRGKGPKNYRRNDERIREDINDRLCDNPYVDASDVDVEVSDGDVILTGTVEDRQAKRMIEDIGDAVSGVKNVENRLRVKIRGV